ncbi:protein phosphatase 1 regulatory subunit 42 [Histomonas meleagridis]|uniref:protein phosphatase 1 regulatory subunit 42 n=1 Tax=Histomonas meleagridis TaxID=135588 RepID=UPI0035599841|nr:protein phosphatase 1 regulatory subunit 42 [Histomonas meleagridis]KAH0804718.1 protein phosphatase 1 regulatory subunit 42 [Histomonas meleagridis]
MGDLGISSFDDEQLHLYSSAICLYAYNNKLKSLNGIEVLDLLEEIQAQHNEISEIPELAPFFLKKLDLRHNCIQKVSGLSQQPVLQELYLSYQNVSKLILTEGCFASQAESLYVLEMESCGIDDTTEIQCLTNLRILNLAKNQISSFDELQRLFSHLPFLEKVDLRGNPICKSPKYRERVIVMGNFTELDDKEVLHVQRETLLRMKSRRTKRTRAPTASSEKENSRNSSLFVRHV